MFLSAELLVSIRYAEIAISKYRILHTTAKTHGGGIIGGVFRVSRISEAFREKIEPITAAKAAISMFLIKGFA